MESHVFSGHIYLFYSFDIGEDIHLSLLKEDKKLIKKPLKNPMYFKNYHAPIEIELSNSNNSPYLDSVKIYGFGAIAIRYKVPFSSTLGDLRKELIETSAAYHETAIKDAQKVFEQVSYAVKQAQFFHLSNVYEVIQVTPEKALYDGHTLKELYGSDIASLLRFETEALATFKKNEILSASIGYYKGDLLIVDTEAAFVYDDSYEDILDIFEFANLQQLELKYFDKTLDSQLNAIFNREVGSLSWTAYLPFWGTIKNDPVGDLGKLRVDISVIIERINSNIKLVGEPYVSEIYARLADKLDILNWQDSLNKKLNIVHDMSHVYANKVDVIREDILEVLVIILILMELITALLKH
ncbi:MAG: hypothetical protein UU47_C0018G0015 [candidate division TM6 bacterium GW2011_GWE2_41_16]|nr:MAG: hypothetical protein UU47_C0018G0015 [candidate division TM6 bacterium GW2011_GWE2_41_16]